MVQAFHFDVTPSRHNQHSNPVSSGGDCMLVGNRRNKGNSMRRREGVEKGERERVCKKERRKEEAPAVGAHHQFLIRKTPQKTNPLAQSGQEARSRLVAGSGWAFCLALFLLRFRGFYFWNFKNIFPEPWTGFPQCSLHCRKSTAPVPRGGSGRLRCQRPCFLF